MNDFDTGREPVVTIDVGNGPKLAEPIWHRDANGQVVAAWQLSDDTIVLDTEIFPHA